MRAYWIKIAIGALLIFCVGYAGILAFRRTKQTVQDVANGSGDISIPLAFVPFSLENQRLGTFRRLVIHRDAPKHVTGLDLTVRLADSSALARLRDCRITVDNPRQINEHTTFRCVTDASGLEEFGELELQVKDADGDWDTSLSVPILLTNGAIQDLRGRANDYRAQATRVQGERLRQLGDSLRTLGIRLGHAQNDGERAQIEREMAEINRQINAASEDLADSLSLQIENAVEQAMKNRQVTVPVAPKTESAPARPPK
jgi:hypothetical protein